MNTNDTSVAPKMLTAQEIFDRVATHLLTQNRASTGYLGGEQFLLFAAKSSGYNKEWNQFSCKYYGENGRKCAIGCLIDDSHYSYKLEGQSIEQLPVREALEQCGVDVRDHKISALLGVLQRIHDCIAPSNWKTSLSTLAAEVELDASVLEKF